jgi:hypothetical protein
MVALCLNSVYFKDSNFDRANRQVFAKRRRSVAQFGKEVATTNEAICRHGCGRKAFGPF